MGFFDGVGQAIGSAASQSAADFINKNVDNTLVSIGVPSSSNLTPQEIEAGLTGEAAQVGVGPTKAPIAAVANASPITVVKKAVIPGALIAAIAIGAYFLLGRKK